MHIPKVVRSTRLTAVLAGLVLGLFLFPATVLGDAELVNSAPADGASMDGPFAGPIVMTFSAPLVGESGAQLRDGAGRVAATDVVTGDTVTLTPDVSLVAGDYEVAWTAIADDGHILRGTFRFTVVVTATPGPTPTASATPAESAPTSSAPATSPSVTPSSAATPAASPAGPEDPDNTGGSGDVLLPIVLGALLVGGLAVLLLRRRDTSVS